MCSTGRQRRPRAGMGGRGRRTSPGSKSGATGIRTPDLLHAMQALYQLSYSPMSYVRKKQRSFSVAEYRYIHRYAPFHPHCILRRLSTMLRFLGQNRRFDPSLKRGASHSLQQYRWEPPPDPLHSARLRVDSMHCFSKPFPPAYESRYRRYWTDGAGRSCASPRSGPRHYCGV